MSHTPFRPSVVGRVAGCPWFRAGALVLYTWMLMSLLCVQSTSALAGENRITTFGEKQARWTLEGKAALVTGGTKVRFISTT